MGCLLNPHIVFLAHIAAFIIGGSFIWSLNAGALEKQFDTLVWLALLAAHGLILYRAKAVVFVYHVVLFSAGTAAIWSVDGAALSQNLALTLAWAALLALVGWLLYRGRQRRFSAPNS